MIRLYIAGHPKDKKIWDNIVTIKCSYCEAMQTKNTIFCSECGTYLLEADKPGTDNSQVDPLGTSALVWSDEYETGIEHSPKDTLIYLTIKHSNEKHQFNLRQTILIGRLDPANEVFPEVDLTSVGGLENGVSRRHARIAYINKQIIVEDMGSINGTFVNDNRLSPYQTEVLHSGDQLQLGKIVIQIELQ